MAQARRCTLWMLLYSFSQGIAVYVYQHVASQLKAWNVSGSDASEVTVINDVHRRHKGAAADARSREILEAYRSMRCRQARCACQPSHVRSSRRASCARLSCFDRHEAILPHWLPRSFQKPPLDSTLIKLSDDDLLPRTPIVTRNAQLSATISSTFAGQP